ncbi:hypothetical protein JOC48_002876 [Aquibacillus albus]|uniref:Uncharacterized protein n=1 Tax=Aquibacillus albus TaxID=1168171 RepID=A0ABS2N2P0_9BACI|nr:hypothetical protein [Aquibacillus albus]
MINTYDLNKLYASIFYIEYDSIKDIPSFSTPYGKGLFGSSVIGTSILH